LGLELGNTELVYRTIMYNILGPKDFTGKYKPVKIESDDVFLKMYGKEESKPKRKLGHFNVVGRNNENVDHLLERVNKIKNSIQIVSINNS